MNITLPDNWSEITLGQWQQMKTLPQDLTETERTIEVVSIILGKDDDEIGSLSEAEMNGIKRHLAWMNEPIPANPKFDITVDDASLSLMTSVSDIESGAWADLERLSRRKSSQDFEHTLQENVRASDIPYTSKSPFRPAK